MQIFSIDAQATVLKSNPFFLVSIIIQSTMQCDLPRCCQTSERCLSWTSINLDLDLSVLIVLAGYNYYKQCVLFAFNSNNVDSNNSRTPCQTSNSL